MIEVLRSGNVVIMRHFAVAESALILARLGETSAALSRLQEAEQLVGQHTARGAGVMPVPYYQLARASLLLGRLDETQRLANRAVEFAGSYPGFLAFALLLLGDIACHPDRFDAESAEAKYREALALAEPRGMRPLAAHCHFCLGRLYRRTTRPQEAHEHLATATMMYREMGLTYNLKWAEAERARVSV